MKLLIYLAVWKRPEITEICFMGIDRLRKAGIHEVDAFAVISEEEMKPLCDKYNIDYVMYKNQPLGEKKNYGLSVAMEKDFDYMVEIGSDDLLKTEFLNFYPWNYNVMGLCDFAIINSENLACRRVSGKYVTFGPGRAIHKDVLKCGKLWSDVIDKRLDNNLTSSLANMGFMDRRYSSAEPLAIDIKSEVNIWPYVPGRGVKYSLDKALDGLSDNEVDAIKSLQYATV